MQAQFILFKVAVLCLQLADWIFENETHNKCFKMLT